jgi:hypothetical protein
MGEYSFWDLVYGTFWGDGCFGGRVGFKVAPPWNYEWTAIIYFLALPLVVVFFFGIILSLKELLKEKKAVYLLLFSQLIVFSLSLVYYAIQAPMYSTVKSFFVLCLILPFAVFTSNGYHAIERVIADKISVHGVVITRTYILLLLVLVFASFWVIP